MAPHKREQRRTALVHDLNVIEKAWSSEIGPDFAAVILNGEHVVILVTSKPALVAAGQLRERLATADSTIVRLVSPRFRRSEMDRIKAEIDAQVPRIPFGIGYESPLNIRECPRIELMIPYRDPRHAELGQRWADEAIARYGDDRVCTRVGEVMLLGAR